MAEAIVGSLAFFATTLSLNAHAHTERFVISIEEDSSGNGPRYQMDVHRTMATVHWPVGQVPGDPTKHVALQRMLAALAGEVFGTTCYVDDIEATLKRLLADDAVLHRINLIATVSNSRHRMARQCVSRLSDCTAGAQVYPASPSRPRIVPQSDTPAQARSDVASSRLSDMGF